jgi:dTDP-4-amino-4,6-dideoxygalactose transaminase
MSVAAGATGATVRTRPFPAWPVYTDADLDGIAGAVRAGVWAAADGPLKQQFEAHFAAFQGAAHAVAVTNGTVSLEIALAALGIGAGDEVIVPPYTFLATASAVLKMNALPVFADIDPATYCLDPAAVEAAITPRTKAIIVVHLGGHPADLDRLLAIKQQHGLALIEDAAHAHGAVWRERKVGAYGEFGSWSFQASKNLTCGEGGALTTDDPALAEMAWNLHNCGRTRGGAWYEHPYLGGNYRLPELQCALLLAGLDRLPEQIARREAGAAYLDRELARFAGIAPLPRDPRATVHAHHLYLCRYDSAAFAGLSRDQFVAALADEGIPASAGYPYPLNQQPLFRDLAFDRRATGYDPAYAPTQFTRLRLPACERACAETVWLPQNLLLAGAADLADVVTAVDKVQRQATR